jgi:undecaprenyl diphosphate synthase
MSRFAKLRGLRRGQSRVEPESRGLWHIVVAGGTSADWESFSELDWESRLGSLAEVAQQAGARYVTVHPFEVLTDPSGRSPMTASPNLYRRELIVPGQFSHGASESMITVVADPVVDGRQRICDEIALWPEGQEITEETLGQALFGPAGEPDLVVILGAPNRLPVSLVWELAYSELVFIPSSWEALSFADVVRAVQEFAQRSRRFGGVEV